MIKLLDLNKTINNILKSNFPNCKIYAGEVKEGFERPCFFTQIVPLRSEYENKNYKSDRLMVVLNYFNEDDTELENIKMYDELINIFMMTLKVKERYFLLQNIRSSIVDNVLQFRFDLDFISQVGKRKEYETMKELEIETNRE